MKIVFLGTGAAVPSKTRKLSSIAITRKNSGEIIIFDAGEGMQYQIINAQLNLIKSQKFSLVIFMGTIYSAYPD